MTVKKCQATSTVKDAPTVQRRKPILRDYSSIEPPEKPSCSSEVDASWIERNLGLTTAVEFPCQVCGAMKPAYSTIQLPYVLFYSTILEEGVTCLWQYTEHLRFADFVPYMLTEYIDDECAKERVCARFLPENLSEYYVELILMTQPSFTCYFDHL